MTVKLIWIEHDAHHKPISIREEILHGETGKSLTKGRVSKLIGRMHPELRCAGGVMLVDASEHNYKWYLFGRKLAPNKWLSVYADPVLSDQRADPAIVDNC